MRHQLSLAGDWQFQLDPEGTLTPDRLAPDRRIPVPLPWQAAFPELREYCGYAWYARSIELDADWLRGELLLRFGAVDYLCQVYINEQFVGEHEGGYTPFTLSVRPYVRPGTNRIAVRVYDPVQSGITIPRWPGRSRPHLPSLYPTAEDVPHGKQEWYINVGGIWQDVTLIAVPSIYIDHVRVMPDIHSGEALISVEVSGTTTDGAGSTDSIDGRLLISVEAGGAGVVAAGAVHLSDGRAGDGTGASTARVYSTSLQVAQPHLWSPEDPYLYTARIRLVTSYGEDELSVRFGFREVSIRDGRLMLNGRPVYLLCALDQDLYPDTIYTVPSREFVADQFRKAKQLGLNSLRCHIKPPDPLYLDLADEMGLLVWAEIPSWRTFHLKGTLYPGQTHLDEAIRRRVERTLEEMVRRDFNHPSLVIWTIVNEDWGTSLPLSAADRQWLASMYERCKQLDPARLVVDNSPCLHPWGPNFHVHSDLDDFHIYAAIPDQAGWFEQMVEQFNLRPVWTYSTFGDAHRTGQEPLVLSEFGNWGLPSLRALREHYGGEPPWFDLGAWWSPWEGEAGWPMGVEERFRRLGLDAIWGDFERFAEATQWHQFEAMKFEIEAIRRQPDLAGYVITEFTDAYWESNGLLDFARNPKVYHRHFASINAPDVIVPRPDRYALWDDEQATIQLYVSHYGSDDWTGARIVWEWVAGREEGAPVPHAGAQPGELQLPPVGTGEVAYPGTVRVGAPKVSEVRTVQLRFTLLSRDGDELAHNYLEMLVLPASARRPRYQGGVFVAAEAEDVSAGAGRAADGSDGALPALGAALARLGYQVLSASAATAAPASGAEVVAVSSYATAGLLDWVRRGGDLLYLCDGPCPFFWVHNRSGAYSGSWISCFNWMRPEAHNRLKVAGPLGLPFMHVVPRWTILGLPVDDPRYQADFLSGMVSGWVRHPAVHTVRFRYGKGRVIMTTFAIAEGLRKGDPVAVALLHDLLEHLSSDQCQPRLNSSLQ